MIYFYKSNKAINGFNILLAVLAQVYKQFT